MAHTPAPWTFLEADDHDQPHNYCQPLTICGGNTDDLANIYSADDADVSIPREEAVANARLIAAAPDLLAAAKITAEYLYVIGDEVKTLTLRNAILADVQAAIAKAEGRS